MTDQQKTDPEKTPEELRSEIEDTREQLGETVEQLAAKADVKARAQEKVEERKQAARDKVEEVKQTTTHTAQTGVAQAKSKPYIPALAIVAAVGVVVLLRRRAS